MNAIASRLGRLFSEKRTEFILSLGDENAVLTYIVRGEIQNAWVAPAEAEEGAMEFAEAFATDTNAPVYLLLDTLEQIYRDEALPQVGMFDQGKVVRRHLQSTFPGKNLVAALPLDPGPDNSRFYLMISAPITESFENWIAYLRNLHNPFAGAYLLPLESLSLLDALSPRTDRGETGHRWCLFITNNASGGVRQIVEKNGKMALTRLTQAPPPDTEAHQFANDIHRDFRTTLTYVKRLGYQPGDALDVVVLMPREVNRYLQEMEWDARSITIMTPNEAAAHLEYGRVGPEGQPYSDLLYARSFHGLKQKAIKLNIGHESQIDYQEIAYKVLPVAATLSVLGLIAYAGQTTFDYIALRQDIEAQKKRVASLDQWHATAVRQLEEQPVEIEMIRRAIGIADALEQGDEFAVMPIVGGVAAALQNRVKISEFQLSTPAAEDRSQSRRRRGAEDEGEGPLAYRVFLTAELPSSILLGEDAVDFVEDLRNHLAARFPDHDVVIARPPVEVRLDQTLRGATGPQGGQDTDAETSVQSRPERRESDPVYNADLEIRKAAS